jgi:hypothetical protein
MGVASFSPSNPYDSWNAFLEELFSYKIKYRFVHYVAGYLNYRRIDELLTRIKCQVLVDWSGEE